MLVFSFHCSNNNNNESYTLASQDLELMILIKVLFLIHISIVSHIYTLRNHVKILDFLIISGGIEMYH